MVKINILLAISFILFLIPLINADTLTSSTTTLDYKGYTITPSLDGKTIIDDKIYSLITEKDSFYIERIDEKPLALTSYYIKTEFNPNELIDVTCITYNQFKSECKGSKFDDTKFLSKNNVTREVMIIDEKGIWWTIENFFKSILGIKPTPAYTYVINYTGTITDTDPAFFETITTATSGTFNKTEASSNGIRNVASVLYFPLDKNDSMDTINYSIGDLNTYYPDGSVYNNFGRSYNPWTNPRNESQINGSLMFDGVNDYVSFPTISLGTNHTITAWFKSRTLTGEDIVIGASGGTGDYAFNMWTLNRVYYYDGTNNPLFTYVRDYNWHMMTIIRNDTNLTAYVDNVLIGANYTMNPVGTLTVNSLAVGFAGAFFDGNLDEVMIFNRTLSNLEASYIYNNQSKGLRLSGLETDANLVTYFQLNEQSGLSASDSKGANTGNLTNFNVNQPPTFQATAGHDGLGTYNFDGNSQAIVLSSGIGANPLTVCVWINVTGYGGGDSGRILDDNKLLFLVTTSNRIRLYNDGNSLLSSSANAFTLGSWNYTCFTRNAKGLSNLYSNGNLVSTANAYAGLPTAGTAALTIGARSVDNIRSFNGSMNDLLVYPYALSSDDIANLYANQTNVSGKYLKLGSQTYESAVFYNSSQTYWNISLSIADTTSTRSGIVNGDNSINTSNEDLLAYYSLDDMTGLSTPFGILNATGLSSKALKFFPDQFVDVPNIETFGNTSLSFWINPQNLPSGSSIVLGRSGSLRKSLYASATGQLVYRDAGTNISIINYPTLLNKWNYITFIINDTGTTGYLNGVYVGSNVFGGTGINDGIDFEVIFSDRTIPGTVQTWTNSSMDEVIMYNKSLTQAEAMQLYGAGLSQKAKTNVTIQTRTANNYNISDLSLLSFWSFNNDSSGDTNSLAVDLLGINNLTCSGATCPNYADSNGTVGGGRTYSATKYWQSNTTNLINGSDATTMTAWIYPTTWVNYAGVVYKYVSSTDAYGFGLYTTPYVSWIVGDSGGLCQLQGGTVNLNQWNFIAGKWSNTENVSSVYVNGVKSTLACAKSKIVQTTPIWVGWDGITGGRMFQGNIDEVRIYNRSLSDAEIEDLRIIGATHISDWGAWTSESLVNDNVVTSTTSYGKFAQYRANLYSNSSDITPYILSYNITQEPNQAPSVDFNNQVPFPLNFSNVFGPQGVNFTYNLSDSDGIDTTTADFYYKVNDTDDNNMYYQNGTGYSGYFARNTLSNDSNKYTWNLLDNSYLTGTYNIGAISEDNLVHKSFSLTSNNEFVSIQYFNISSVRQLGFFELMANRSSGTGGLRAYYCNNNWDTNSNPATNADCLNFYTLTNNTYDHCHTNQSCHMVLPFTNFSIITQTGYFIVRGNTGSTWNIWYSDGAVRSNYIKKASNPSTWAFNNSINIDGHLHQFNINTTLYSYVCVNDTYGLQNCSSTRIQTIGGGTIAPTGLSVLNPTNTTYEKGGMNINYTQCYSPSSLPIMFYNITLVNTDGTYNLSIVENNTLNLNYSWNNLLITSGSYKVEVKCYDNTLTSSLARSEVFNLIPDATNPVLSVTSPQNATFFSTDIPLISSCTDNIAINRTFYSLNGGSNITYTSPATITTIGYELYHYLTFYCEDTSGNLDSLNRRVYVGITSNGTSIPSGTTSVSSCKYKKLGYYNTKLPWIKEQGCI